MRVPNNERTNRITTTPDLDPEPTTPSRRINRRTALKAIGGLAVGSAIAGGGLYYFTQPAVAASVNISGTVVETDAGHLSFVDLDLTDYFAIWDGFDIPVAAVAYEDILEVNTAEDEFGEHTLFDQRDAAGPVLLSEISTEGNGGDGWGGPGEYASTFDGTTSPDTTVTNQPGVDGPSEATAGWVHADVLWRLISDDLAEHPALSIETPAVHGTDIPLLDAETDGSTEDHVVTLVKRVHLYQSEDNLEDPVTTDRAGATVYPMTAGDDGTIATIQATPSFTVRVKNQETNDTNDGSGSTSGG